MEYTSHSQVTYDGDLFQMYPNGLAQQSVSDQKKFFFDTTKPKHAFDIPNDRDRLQIWTEECSALNSRNTDNIDIQAAFVSNLALGQSPTASKFSPQPDDFLHSPTEKDPTYMTEQTDLNYILHHLSRMAPFPQQQSQNNNLLNLQDPLPLLIDPDDLKRKSPFTDDNGHESKRRGITVPDQDEPFVFQNSTFQWPIITTPSGKFNDATKSPSLSSKVGNATSNDGKVCTTRPKAVVPEKFLNDGSAEAALGMTIAEIQTFPTFEELLKKVHPNNCQKAILFGEKITRNRIKAKHAAKRSRDQRRAKIERVERLEKQTKELQDQVEDMRALLGQLVESGAINREVVQAYI